MAKNQNNTISDLVSDLGIERIATLGHFCRTYKVNTQLRFVSYERVDDLVYKYFLSKKDEIQRFEKDWYTAKTPTQIAQTINQPLEKILEFFSEPENSSTVPFYFENSSVYADTNIRYTSTDALKKYFEGSLKPYRIEVVNSAPVHTKNKHSALPFTQGYKEIEAYILEQLEPLLHPDEQLEWGLSNPGGILLYGPPGCGKTHWAIWIARYIQYKLQEVPRSAFGSQYVDGAMNNLIEILNSVKPKTALFFDEFDSIAAARSNRSSSSEENSKVVNTLLQEIPKLVQKQVLIIGATNFINRLDTAVVRPGRFDLKLPIFPPLPIERANLLYKTIISNALGKALPETSLLIHVLNSVNANNEEYWQSYGHKMILFSNSLVIDVGRSVKLKLKKKYQEKEKIDKKVLKEIVVEAIKETSAKLTKKDVEFYANFYTEIDEAKLSSFDFRKDNLYKELKAFYGDDKNAPRPIGFQIPKVTPEDNS